MDINLYTEIVTFIHNHRGLTKNCLSCLQEKYSKFVSLLVKITLQHIFERKKMIDFSLHPGTLASILSQEYQKQIKQSNYKNTTAPDNLYNKYTEQKSKTNTPGVLINIAIEGGLAPSLAARLILKQFCDEQVDYEEENASKSTKRNITAMMKDTTLIEDKNLAYEVFLVRPMII